MESREVTVSDIELICRHREEMFREAGRDEETLRIMTESFRDWLRPRLCTVVHRRVLAKRSAWVAAAGSLLWVVALRADGTGEAPVAP